MGVDVTPADNLYDAIKDLRGWDDLLLQAQDVFFGGRPAQSNAGRLISSLLLAGGEDSVPIAVTGTLAEDGEGRLVIIYSDTIVMADVTNIKEAGGSFSVRCWPASAARDLEVQTRHSYFDGTDRRPRTTGLIVDFSVSGEKISLQSSVYRSASPLTTDAAIYSAFEMLRGAS